MIILNPMLYPEMKGILWSCFFSSPLLPPFLTSSRFCKYSHMFCWLGLQTSMVLYCSARYCMVLYCIAWYFIVLNGIKWYYYRVVHLVMLPILISGHFFSLGWGGEGYEQNFLGSKSESCLKVLYLNVSSSFQHWERRNKDMNVKESE